LSSRHDLSNTSNPKKDVVTAVGQRCHIRELSQSDPNCVIERGRLQNGQEVVGME
jgi:hypothetical protein